MKGNVPRVLVVEDETALRDLLRDELKDDGLEVVTVESAEEAVAPLSSERIDLVVSDLRLPGADGLVLLERTRTMERPPAFIIITAFGTIDQAVSALQRGADDFLTKPLDLDHLSVRVARVLETRRLRHELLRYREAMGAPDFHGMVGRSKAMMDLFRDLERIARGHGPVLLQGESGTGKELAARAIHAESPRAGEPFMAVNCAGIPEALLESEFFGHVKGAFTGATSTRAGLFQQADGGTLLLDEVGEMPSGLQAKLLRVLQEGEVKPVGSDHNTPVDVRIIAATHRELTAETSDSEQTGLRRDLYYRLETFRLVVPPLRERVGDVDLLAARFVQRHAVRLDRTPPEVGIEFLEILRAYDFPGNVRELENLVERAVTFCEGGRLEPRHLPARVREHTSSATPSGNGAERSELGAAGSLVAEDEIMPLKELERRYVQHVLDQVDGNKRRAAALLGIGRRTLYRKLDGE
ncbi:MAG: sigma-54 dependent transcriptional regulator [Gemmatimonadota bacterium]|nr:sigma-54 dependent transcriptional regulator [Gemmatimonadota bacterium]